MQVILLYNKYVLEEMYQYIKEDTKSIYFGKICSISDDGSKNNKRSLRKPKRDFRREKLLNGNSLCPHQSIFCAKGIASQSLF